MGDDPEKNSQQDNITKFPSLAERDRRARKQREKEKEWQKQYRAQNRTPFFNKSKLPPVTRNLALSFFVIHLIMSFLVPNDWVMIISVYGGFVPGLYTGALQFSLSTISGPFTYAFLHGGWMHLGFNLVMMLALGSMFEKKYSSRALAIFFFACSLGGAAIYMLLDPFSNAPMIGASGGLSGLFAAMMIMMYYQQRYALGQRIQQTGQSLHKAAGFFMNNKYGVWPLLLFWGALMTFIGWLFGGVAWQGHLGGYITGIILYRGMQTGKIRL